MWAGLDAHRADAPALLELHLVGIGVQAPTGAVVHGMCSGPTLFAGAGAGPVLVIRVFLDYFHEFLGACNRTPVLSEAPLE